MDFQNHEKGSIITSVNFEIVNFDFEKRNLIEVTVKFHAKVLPDESSDESTHFPNPYTTRLNVASIFFPMF